MGIRAPGAEGGSPSTNSLVILVTSNRRRGAEVNGRRVADGLADRGWDVSLVSLGQEPGGIETDGLGVATPGRLGGVNFKVLRALRRRLASQRPAIVLANGGATLRYAVLATRLMRRRPVLVYGSIGEPKYWLRSDRHRRFQRWLIDRCQGVIAISRETARQLEEQGVESDRISVAHPGAPTSWFVETEPSSDGPLRVLWIGSLSTEKDPLTALRAVAEAGADVSLRVIGDGPLRHEMEAMAETLGISGSVEFMGSVDDIRPHLSWAAVLLVSSLTEGLPGVAVEAAAAALATVATRVGGLAEVVDEGVTGHLVEAGDVAAMAATLDRLAADRSATAEMGAAARRRAGEKFTMQASVSAYEAGLLRFLPGADKEPGVLRIAHLTTVDLSLRYLLLAQLSAPLEVGIESIGISAPGPYVDELERAGVRHEPLPSSTRGFSFRSDLAAARDLWRVLRRVRPDVLHTHNPKPGVYGRIVGRLAGVPIVVNTIHGLYATESDRLLKRAVVYGLEAVASRFSDAELVQSSEDYDLLRRRRIVAPSKLRILGNGVDLAHFDPTRFDDSDRRWARHEMGVDDDRVVVGMVGRLVFEKGYLELFQAAEQLDDRFVIAVIGPEDTVKGDALTPEAVERARDAGVLFLGMRQDVDRLYAGMDVFVLPSHREGFPRAAMEAAAMGLPIVATDIRGCRQVVEDGVNGRLIPVRNPDSLAAAITELGDADLRERMGKAGLERARRHFDDRTVVGIVMGTYQSVARAKGRRELASLLAGSGGGPVRVRPAEPADVTFLAGLHHHAIGTGFLSRLGPRFLKVLYRALVADEESVVLVAVDGAGPVGFVTGVASTGGFYRRFLRRWSGRAIWASLPTMLLPANLRRAWETLRYGSGEDETPAAELLSMAVVNERRGMGIGGELGKALLDRLAAGGSERVVVTVGAANAGAIRAYQSMGFRHLRGFEVHAGEASELLVWEPSASG